MLMHSKCIFIPDNSSRCLMFNMHNRLQHRTVAKREDTCCTFQSSWKSTFSCAHNSDGRDRHWFHLLQTNGKPHRVWYPSIRTVNVSSVTVPYGTLPEPSEPQVLSGTDSMALKIFRRRWSGRSTKPQCLQPLTYTVLSRFNRNVPKLRQLTGRHPNLRVGRLLGRRGARTR